MDPFNISDKSFSFSNLRNVDFEQIFIQIKDLLNNQESFTDSIMTDIVKEIKYHKDKEKLIIQLVRYLWNFESDTSDYFVYALINSSNDMDRTASKNLFEEIKKLLGQDRLLQRKLIGMIPVLISNIRRFDDEFTGFIDIDEIDCHFDNLVSVITVMREMCTLKNSEKAILIKKLLDILGSIDLIHCPELVREILLLCDKGNFQFCIGAIINFFDNKPVSCSQLSQTRMSSDSKRLMKIQLSVLSYCYEIAIVDKEFVKEILKFCKNRNPVFSISGFMCIILLNLSGIDHIKDQILDFLKLCITSCFKDNKLILESAFIRESVRDQFDMDSLLLNAVKYCCVSERNQISNSLLQLGFLLIKSGLPKSKIVTLKSQFKNKDEILIGEMSNNDFNMTTLQKVGQAGVQMLIHLFKKLSACRQTILDSILSFILKESHKPSVFVYLELFADLISLMPLEMQSNIDKFDGKPVFELICLFPHDVALSVVHALLPLIRYSASVLKQLLAVVMTSMLSGQEHSRMICVEAALILLKYLRVTVATDNSQLPESDLMTQSSQFACTQIAAESTVLSIDNSANKDICREILAVLDEACQQYWDTRAVIYKGLVQVAERNFHFSGKIVLFLLSRLDAVIDKSSLSPTNPFVISKIVVARHQEARVEEPLSVLVSCLTESVRLCKQNMPPRDILTCTVDEHVCTSDALQQAEALLRDLLIRLSAHELDETAPEEASLVSISVTEQFIELFEVLLAHFICSGDSNKESVRKVFDRREKAIRSLKSDKKGRKEDQSCVISLPSLAECLRHLLEPLLGEINTARMTQARARKSQRSLLELSLDSSSRNIVVDDQGSLALFLNENVSAYFLSRAISLIKKIGGAQCRVTSRNRKEVCVVLAEFVRFSLDFYLGCLCADKPESLSTPQRQLMQSCATLYCVTMNKIVQFFSSTIDQFLHEVHGVCEHLQTLQRKTGLTDRVEDCAPSVGLFVRINKAVIARILLLAQKRLYADIDALLNVTLNLAIFCGLDDMRRSVASGCSKMNISLLNSLYNWLSGLLRTSELSSTHNGLESTQPVDLQDSHVSRALVSLTLIISRMVRPDSICFIEKLATEINGKISSYSAVLPGQFHSSFLLLNNANDILPDLIGAISTSLDDTDWLLTKWKCGWLEIKQNKAISNSQLSNLGPTPVDLQENSLSSVIDQDRILVEQLQSVCLSITKLIQCSINSVLRLQELVRITGRFFDQLTVLTKQYIVLTKAKLGSCSSNFKKLVLISGGDLSAQVSLFIIYIQKVESISRSAGKEEIEKENSDSLFADEEKDKKKKNKTNLNNQMGRTDKEIKLIPNLVFSLEQYQRYLIELQRISKIDLMKYVKIVNSRDFRIDLTKLHESLDQNVSVDLSDSEEECTNDRELENVEVCPSGNNHTRSPPKKRKKDSSNAK